MLKFATGSKLSRAELFTSYIRKYQDGSDPVKKKIKKTDTTEKKLDFNLDEEEET